MTIVGHNHTRRSIFFTNCTELKDVMNLNYIHRFQVPLDIHKKQSMGSHHCSTTWGDISITIRPIVVKFLVDHCVAKPPAGKRLSVPMDIYNYHLGDGSPLNTTC